MFKPRWKPRQLYKISLKNSSCNKHVPIFDNICFGSPDPTHNIYQIFRNQCPGGILLKRCFRINTCVRPVFFNKVKGWWQTTLLKGDWILQNYLEHFFTESRRLLLVPHYKYQKNFKFIWHEIYLSCNYQLMKPI